MENGKIIAIIGAVMFAFGFGIIITGDLYRGEIKRCIEQKVTLELCSKIYGWSE